MSVSAHELHTIRVKPVGLTKQDLATLQAVLALAGGEHQRYVLWSAAERMPPDIVVMDVDSFEAGMELLSPKSPSLTVLRIGAVASHGQLPSLSRPLSGPELLAQLESHQDQVKVPQTPPMAGETAFLMVQVQKRHVLFGGLPRDEAIYLRARMALAFITDIDDNHEAPQDLIAAGLPSQAWHLAFVMLGDPVSPPWAWLDYVRSGVQQPDKIIGILPQGATVSDADALKKGCSAVLQLPLTPQAVVACLQAL